MRSATKGQNRHAINRAVCRTKTAAAVCDCFIQAGTRMKRAFNTFVERESSMSSTFASYREVIDANGRVYRVGETDRELLGRSRAWMIWLPWMAMMAISVYEYGYGAAAKSIREAHHWSMGETFWLLSIWAFFQAGVAL